MTSFLEPEFEPPVELDGFRVRRARLGRQAGAEHLGASLFEIEPGNAPFPLHFHFGNEELLIVLSGSPVLRVLDGERELAEGEVVAFPRGEHGAHQLIARGDGPARFLMLSEMRKPDICVYPDSGKVGVRNPGLRLNFRTEDAVHYWDGEDPPR